ncbi:putative endoglucanase, partial [Tothia fuscella]
MGSILCHYITALFLFVSSCLAHVSMSDPPPIRSSKNPYTSSQNIDYDYSAPLSPSGSNYPCKGYQKDTPVKTVKSYQAGETYEMGFTGSATHMGGSCQISLSYDNGDTFKVIKSMIGGCPQKSSYNFTIPSSAPSGNALIAWTWLNYEGNREFYMNCAWVAIDGSSNGNLNSLPNVWVANVKGVTDCTTEEKEDPVFPHPGPDVEYGNGESSSSTPTP